MEFHLNQTTEKVLNREALNTFDLKMIALMAIFSIVVSFLYRETFVYLLHDWTQWQHGEYAHGFAVLAVAAFMIWGLRKELLQIEIHSSFLGIPLILLFSLSWMIGILVGIRVIESLSLFMILPSLIYALTGASFVSRLWFPLTFILVAFPIWDLLLPFLQDIAASIAYVFLKITGITVLREGAYLSIPAGQFLVAEGCSGLRYLLAAMTFGGFYIYLENLTKWRASLFFIVVVIAAIVANAVRITMVVLAGQMTNMQHPWIHDHLSLGWYLFAGMLFPVFWMGIKLSRLQQAHEEESVISTPALSSEVNTEYQVKTQSKIFMIFIPALLLALVAGPWIKKVVIDRARLSEFSTVDLKAPEGVNGWKKMVSNSTRLNISNNEGPHPSFAGADHTIDQVYASGENKVRLYIANYLSQQQDKEMINVNNVLYHEEHWQPVSHSTNEFSTGNHPRNVFKVKQVYLKNNQGAEYIYWSWFRTSGFKTTRPVLTKIYDLYGLITNQTNSSVIMIGMKKTDDEEKTNRLLNQFLSVMDKQIDNELDKLND